MNIDNLKYRITLTSADTGLPVLVRIELFEVAEQKPDLTNVYLASCDGTYMVQVKETAAQIDDLIHRNLLGI